MAIHRTARYRVRPEETAVVLEAVREFVAAVADEPGTLLYEALQSSAEPTEFLHVMAFEDADAQRAHQEADHTRRFVETLYPRCEEEPAFDDAAIVATTRAG